MLQALNTLAIIEETDTRHIASVLEQNDDPLDQIMCKLGLITEEKLAHAYSTLFSIAVLDEHAIGDEAYKFPEKVTKALNQEFLYANRLAPIMSTATVVTIAIVDPSMNTAIQGVRFALQCPVELRLVTASQFERLYAAVFPEANRSENKIDDIDTASDIDQLKDLASAEPVVRHVNFLISEAARKRASDIHIEPMERSATIRYRVDGTLSDFETISPAQSLSLISRLKILSDLDIAEQRRPQDGRMSFSVGGRVIDLRLSTNPTVNGESLVIRLLDQSRAPLSLEGLGFNQETQALLKSWIAAPNGIILLTGPTGSGKTTTLYSLLQMLANGERKILTIEDPVEYKLPGVNQSQVNPAIGVTFAEALRSFLRHDPDVSMVGEMRDAETARIAMRAAMTGHLVLSTLHTNDAASAVTRLLDMGIEDYLVSSALLGVVGQRLVKRLCNSCGKSKTENSAKTCPACDDTGFHGRLVISETLNIDNAVKDKIKQGATARDIIEAARVQNFHPMITDGRMKIERHLTTSDEVRRTVGADAT